MLRRMAATGLLTTKEVAALARVSVRTINRWAEAGVIPPVHKIPGRTGAYLFDAHTVTAWLDEQGRS